MADAPASGPSGGFGAFFRKKLDDAKKGVAALSKQVEHALRTVDWTSFATVVRLRPAMTVEEVAAKLGPPASTEIDAGGEGCCKWGKGSGASVHIEVAGRKILSVEGTGLVYDLGKPGEVPDELAFADFTRLHEGMNPFEALDLLGLPASASFHASGRDAEGSGWGTTEMTFAWRHPSRTPPGEETVARVSAGMTLAEVTRLIGRPDEARHLRTQGPDGRWEDRSSVAWTTGRRVSVELRGGAVARVSNS